MESRQKMQPLEAECKFRVRHHQPVIDALIGLHAVAIGTESHCDTYLRHPSRDFRTTDEALRIREIDGLPYLTYKGPRLSGPIKIRTEIELPLHRGDKSSWLEVWKHLGFSIVTEVVKKRTIYRLDSERRPLTITLDEVEKLGSFVEIERILEQSDEVEQAEKDILAVAQMLGLRDIEKRSYLGLLLESTNASEGTSHGVGNHD